MLSGIRVLDFCVVWAGPYTARMLAEMGAEVIHVEHPELAGHVGQVRVGSSAKMALALGMKGIDPNEVGSKAPWKGVRDTYTAAYSSYKKFITLDSTRPEGKEVLGELVKKSDICIENLTPGAAAKLGIAYDELKVYNPSIIKCSMRSFGEGPWNNFVAYGNTMEYLSGITSLTGYGGADGNRPMRSGVFTADPIASMQGVGAIISALLYRRRTGKGMNIELSQYESAAHFVNPAIVDYTMNKQVPAPAGNSDPAVPFEGCYPAKGRDQWVVISIRDNNDWGRLCGAIGKSQWLEIPGYSDVSALKDKRQEIDEAISAWTRERDKQEIARFLQSLNVPAAPVNELTDTMFSAPLRHRRLYKEIRHPYGGVAFTPSMPVQFGKVVYPDSYTPAGAVGADNDNVYSELLGLSADRIKELKDREIV